MIFCTDKKLDTDDPDHIQWLLDQAQARAQKFNITGVTWSLTQGVVKNIIPAIASTNAVIAGVSLSLPGQFIFSGLSDVFLPVFFTPLTAACTQEAFKFATTCAPYLNNYMMYTGNESVYTYTFEHERRPECPVCGGESRDFELEREWKLERVIEMLLEIQDL